MEKCLQEMKTRRLPAARTSTLKGKTRATCLSTMLFHYRDNIFSRVLPKYDLFRLKGLDKTKGRIHPKLDHPRFYLPTCMPEVCSHHSAT